MRKTRFCINAKNAKVVKYAKKSRLRVNQKMGRDKTGQRKGLRVTWNGAKTRFCRTAMGRWRSFAFLQKIFGTWDAARGARKTNVKTLLNHVARTLATKHKKRTAHNRGSPFIKIRFSRPSSRATRPYPKPWKRIDTPEYQP